MPIILSKSLKLFLDPHELVEIIVLGVGRILLNQRYVLEVLQQES